MMAPRNTMVFLDLALYATLYFLLPALVALQHVDGRQVVPGSTRSYSDKLYSAPCQHCDQVVQAEALRLANNKKRNIKPSIMTQATENVHKECIQYHVDRYNSTKESVECRFDYHWNRINGSNVVINTYSDKFFPDKPAPTAQDFLSKAQELHLETRDGKLQPKQGKAGVLKNATASGTSSATNGISPSIQWHGEPWREVLCAVLDDFDPSTKAPWSKNDTQEATKLYIPVRKEIQGRASFPILRFNVDNPKATVIATMVTNNLLHSDTDHTKFWDAFPWSSKYSLAAELVQLLKDGWVIVCTGHCDTHVRGYYKPNAVKEWIWCFGEAVVLVISGDPKYMTVEEASTAEARFHYLANASALAFLGSKGQTSMHLVLVKADHPSVRCRVFEARAEILTDADVDPVDAALDTCVDNGLDEADQPEIDPDTLAAMAPELRVFMDNQ